MGGCGMWTFLNPEGETCQLKSPNFCFKVVDLKKKKEEKKESVQKKNPLVLPSDPRWSRRAPWRRTATHLQGRGWPPPSWVRSEAGRRCRGTSPVSSWGWAPTGCRWKAGCRWWLAGWEKVMGWAGPGDEVGHGTTLEKLAGAAGCYR